MGYDQGEQEHHAQSDNQAAERESSNALHDFSSGIRMAGADIIRICNAYSGRVANQVMINNVLTVCSLQKIQAAVLDSKLKEFTDDEIRRVLKRYPPLSDSQWPREKLDYFQSILFPAIESDAAQQVQDQYQQPLNDLVAKLKELHDQARSSGRQQQIENLYKHIDLRAPDINRYQTYMRLVKGVVSMQRSVRTTFFGRAPVMGWGKGSMTVDALEGDVYRMINIAFDAKKVSVFLTQDTFGKTMYMNKTNAAWVEKDIAERAAVVLQQQVDVGFKDSLGGEAADDVNQPALLRKRAGEIEVKYAPMLETLVLKLQGLEGKAQRFKESYRKPYEALLNAQGQYET